MKDVVSITQGLFALSKVSYTFRETVPSGALSPFIFILIFLPNRNRKLLDWNQRTSSSNKISQLLQSSSQSLTAGYAMNNKRKNANKPTLPSLSSTRSSPRSGMRKFKGTYWLTPSQKLRVSNTPFSFFWPPYLAWGSAIDSSFHFNSIQF